MDTFELVMELPTCDVVKALDATCIEEAEEEAQREILELVKKLDASGVSQEVIEALTFHVVRCEVQVIKLH